MKPHKLPELKFRHFLDSQMKGHWKHTWHEDREISPGVPDLHYMMMGPTKSCLGWLELKAIDEPMSKKHYIHVEPSQHQYIRRWIDFMPIDFLIRIQAQVYVVPGRFHNELATSRSLEDLRHFVDLEFHESQTGIQLPIYLYEKTKI